MRDLANDLLTHVPSPSVAILFYSCPIFINLFMMIFINFLVASLLFLSIRSKSFRSTLLLNLVLLILSYFITGLARNVEKIIIIHSQCILTYSNCLYLLEKALIGESKILGNQNKFNQHTERNLKAGLSRLVGMYACLGGRHAEIKRSMPISLVSRIIQLLL